MRVHYSERDDSMTKLSKFLSVILLITLVLLGKTIVTDNTLYQGEIALPIQVDIKDSEEIVHKGKEGEVGILPRAEYEIIGVVKSKKKYSDYPSQISEYDLTIAWGDLNKKEIDSFINYSQSGRWYYYKYTAESPVQSDYISKHSANVHIIHSNSEVLNHIKNIKEGDYIKLKGYLVDVDFKSPNTSIWKTSMARNDTGNGACEILYVEEVKVID